MVVTVSPSVMEVVLGNPSPPNSSTTFTPPEVEWVEEAPPSFLLLLDQVQYNSKKIQTVD